MEYYSVIKRNEILIYSQSWKCFSKWNKSDIKGQILYDYLYAVYRTEKFIEIEDTTVSAGDRGDEINGELSLKEYSVSVQDDKKKNVLELDNDACCTTFWMY